MKKLLSEVIGRNVKDICEESANGCDLTIYGDESVCLGVYNIYELAHKCKEWAIDKHDCVVVSRSRYKLDGYDCDLYFDNCDIDEEFVADTEPEAIFKACEWILEQKDRP